jgi:plastocyanin
VRVAQREKSFSVREVALKVNEPLLFVNEDSVTHNVYSVTKGMEFEIRTQQPGQTDTIRFSHEGEAEVLLRVMVKP